MSRCSQMLKAIRKVADGRSRGATLVEVVAAIIVLSLLVASVPSSLVAIINYQNRQNEKRIAENIARNQIEYIKAQDYIWGNETYPIRYDYIRPEINFGVAPPEAVPVWIEYHDEDGSIKNVKEYDRKTTGNVTTFEQDDGIQKITITIWGLGASVKPILEVVTFKANYEGS